MAIFRALAYFFEEAFTSLWRSLLMNALSVGTIAVSLFVLGAFLAVAGSLNEVVQRWTQKVQVIFYLEDGIEDRVRESLENRLAQVPVPVVAIHPVVQARRVIVEHTPIDGKRAMQGTLF